MVAASAAMEKAAAETRSNMDNAASADASLLVTAIATEFIVQVTASGDGDLKTAADSYKSATLDAALQAMTVSVTVAAPTTTTGSASTGAAASSAAEFSMAGFVLAVGSLLF